MVKMKTIKQVSYTIHFMLVVLISVLSSCSDVKELDMGAVDRYTNDGVPEITAIYDMQDTDLSSPLTSGFLNQYIHLVGKNLANVKSINIDGLDVDIDSRSYSENGDSYIRIPRAIPENGTGVIRYETDKGSTSFKFAVFVPSLRFDGLSNEFAWQGSKVQLIGEYFDLYQFGDTLEASPVKIEINNTEEDYHAIVHCDSCSEALTTMRIPLDCPDNSLITFSWEESGEKHMSKTIYYRPIDKLMFGDFKDFGFWNEEGSAELTNGGNPGDPEWLGFPFQRHNVTLGSWDWWSTGIGGPWRYDFGSEEIDSFDFVFEVCTASSTPFYDYSYNGWNEARAGGYMFTIGGGIRTQWDPINNNGLTNTGGKWRTVHLPLSQFMAGVVPPDKGAWVDFEFACQPNNESGWVVDHSFAHFRIQKNK